MRLIPDQHILLQNYHSLTKNLNCCWNPIILVWGPGYSNSFGLWFGHLSVVMEVGRQQEFKLLFRAFSRAFLPFFKILSKFVYFCPNFQIFCPFLPFFLKIACMPVLSRIGPVIIVLLFVTWQKIGSMRFGISIRQALSAGHRLENFLWGCLKQIWKL